MKKLLTLLGAVGLITIATTTVVACGNREKGKLVNITEFEKKVIFEAQGRHQTIDQAKEAIAIISDLPEGIESINVTTVNNNIKVVFIAQDGYQTPNPLIIKFIKNNKQENKITKELVDAELTKLLVKEKTYETDELAIAAIQAIETDAFKVKEASKLTKAFEQHTFNVIVEAKSGYVLAEGIEEGQTTIELSIGKADQQLTKALVDEQLSKLLVEEKTYETDELAIAAIQAVETDAFKVKEASKLTKAFEQHTFNVIVEAKSGYVLAEGIEEGQTTIELSIGKAEQQLTKALVDEQLTKLLVEEKTYETDELAIAAIQAVETDAFKVKEASKLTKAFEQHTFNVIVEAKSGYVLAEGIEEGQTTIELSIGKADQQLTKALVDEQLSKLLVEEKTYETDELAIAAIQAVETDAFKVKEASKLTKAFEQHTFNVIVEAKSGYVLVEGIEEGQTTIELSVGEPDIAVTKTGIDAEIERIKSKVSEITFINGTHLLQALNGMWTLEGTNVEVEWATKSENQQVFVTSTDLFRFTIGVEAGYSFEQSLELEGEKYVTEVLITYKFKDQEIKKWAIEEEIEEVKAKVSKLTIINEAQLIGALNGFWGLEGTNVEVERAVEPANQSTFGTYSEIFKFTIGAEKGYAFQEGIELQDGKYITEASVIYNFDNKEITKLDIDQAIDEVKDKIGELEIINEAQLIGALNGYWDLKGTSAKVERVKKLTNKDTFATTYTDNFRFIIEVNADYYFAQTLELKDGKYITEELITYHYK